MRACAGCGQSIAAESDLAFAAGSFGSWRAVHRACASVLAAAPGFERAGLRLLSPAQARAWRRAATWGAATALALWAMGTALVFRAWSLAPADGVVPWLAAVTLGVGGPVAVVLAWEVTRIRRSLR